ncbi:MAG: MarR family transcriptional regulator [Paracoccus sp. (in: a-proteobacteria)]|uniref:MarR family winged helix-turn-helix transcriptional regulator n=1 Tax=Paracoccus sp. TaxID=267 RepID=UPI0026E04E4D|nr:MarR family transcriptional regulator [Paracoccus sp. (in: a-proteobacteria)]MDO5631975.1 MarR family transcriptional regulator [Paracoccus sp. (in: a-proteobacteria)]
MSDTTRHTDTFGADLSNRLAFRLYQCANQLNKTGTKWMERHEVTTQQWAIIGALVNPRWRDGIAVRHLAGVLMVSRQNLTGVLSRLESRGWVERTMDEQDNRSRLIRLTPEGWQRWADMQADILSFYDAAMKGMSNSDKIHLLHHLDTLRHNFRDIDQAQGGEG